MKEAFAWTIWTRDGSFSGYSYKSKDAARAHMKLLEVSHGKVYELRKMRLAVARIWTHGRARGYLGKKYLKDVEKAY